MDLYESEGKEDESRAPCEEGEGDADGAVDFLKVGPDGITDPSADDDEDELAERDGPNNAVLNLDVLWDFDGFDWHLAIIPHITVPFHPWGGWWLTTVTGDNASGALSAEIRYRHHLAGQH